MLEFFAGRQLAVCSLIIIRQSSVDRHVHVRFHIWLTERTTLRTDLPDEPVYQDSSGILRDLTLPCQSGRPRVHLPVLFEGGYITSVQLTEIGKGTLFPASIRVKYWDSFEREHETRFCYIYRIAMAVPFHKGRANRCFERVPNGGPRAYIRNT